MIQFGLLVLEKKIFEFFGAFSLFRYYLPLERGYLLSVKKT
jgi:hypothetical protein